MTRMNASQLESLGSLLPTQPRRDRPLRGDLVSPETEELHVRKSHLRAVFSETGSLDGPGVGGLSDPTGEFRCGYTPCKITPKSKQNNYDCKKRGGGYNTSRQRDSSRDVRKGPRALPAPGPLGTSTLQGRCGLRTQGHAGIGHRAPGAWGVAMSAKSRVNAGQTRRSADAQTAASGHRALVALVRSLSLLLRVMGSPERLPRRGVAGPGEPFQNVILDAARRRVCRGSHQGSRDRVQSALRSR